MHSVPIAARLPSRGLYAISNGPRPDLLEACAAALAGGAAVLQYRDKTTQHQRRESECLALAQLCRDHNVPLIVNDDVELALAANADGVHLGDGDADISVARQRLGTGKIIGASCYDSVDRAQKLADAGADYLAFGAFFTSPTKPAARRATVDLLRSARTFNKPLVAIGGITAENASVLIDAGADFIAAISGVFAQRNVQEAAQRYAALFKK